LITGASVTREQFESTLVKSPEPGRSGEAVFDFRNLPKAPAPEFRCCTVYEWSEDGLALEECWQAYLDDIEADWTE